MTIAEPLVAGAAGLVAPPGPAFWTGSVVGGFGEVVVVVTGSMMSDGRPASGPDGSGGLVVVVVVGAGA
jgi:hypothetical protein